MLGSISGVQLLAKQEFNRFLYVHGLQLKITLAGSVTLRLQIYFKLNKFCKLKDPMVEFSS